MNRYLVLAIISAFLMISCSDSADSTETKSKTELLQYTWKVAAMQLDGQALPINSGDVDKIRITFNGNNYTYVYPAPPNSPAEQLGTMLTLTGPWRFNEDETKLYLDRSMIDEPEFEWEIVQLSPAIFRARYRAINPFDFTKESVYDFSYMIDL
jgi:hypothetical protein